MKQQMLFLFVTCATIAAILCLIVSNYFCNKRWSDSSKEGSMESNIPSKIEIGNSTGWWRVAEYFDESVDKTIDPCDNFFAFACGKYRGTGRQPPYHELIKKSTKDKVECITSFKTDENTPRTLLQVKLIYEKCVNLTENSLNITQLIPIIQNLGGWPLLFQDQTNDTWNPYALMGVLQSLHIDNIFSASILPNTKHHEKGNMIHLDQAEPLLSKAMYQGAMGRYIKDIIHDIVHDAANALGITLNEDKLKNDINVMVLMDYRLAMATDDKYQRENFSLYYHEFNVTTAKTRWPHIDWESYFHTLASDNFDPDKVIKNAFNIARPDFVDILSQLPITPGKGAVHAQNYLIFTFIWGIMRRMPFYSGLDGNSVDTNEQKCSDQIHDLLPWAGSRIFIDYSFSKLPGKPRQVLHLMSYMVLEGFQSMIKETPWMTDHGKLGAYEKIFDVQKNVAYPLWIMDDEELDERHPEDRLNILPNDDAFTMFDKLFKFATWFKWHRFLEPVDRSEFGEPPWVFNAWYSDVYNSITFPAAFLHAPMFDVEFPMAFNFGSLGSVMGHELVHGFDNRGSQFDENGELRNWMDDTTNESFKNMSKCLINQYNHFCYPEFDDVCVNGTFTLGENIADNGGVGGAYLAYQAYVDQFGDEPRIPGGWQNYTMDQIFFLSMSHLWCEDASQYPWNLKWDPHSPPMYRVIGSLQNNPHFQEAFGCKPGSGMNPKHKCPGWHH